MTYDIMIYFEKIIIYTGWWLSTLFWRLDLKTTREYTARIYKLKHKIAACMITQEKLVTARLYNEPEFWKPYAQWLNVLSRRNRLTL